MAEDTTFDLLIATLDRVIYEGKARSLILPGEQGTFEVLPLHRPLMSRLLIGLIVIDGRSFPIRRGVLRIADDVVTAVVEPRG